MGSERRLLGDRFLQSVIVMMKIVTTPTLTYLLVVDQHKTYNIHLRKMNN